MAKWLCQIDSLTFLQRIPTMSQEKSELCPGCKENPRPTNGLRFCPSCQKVINQERARPRKAAQKTAGTKKSAKSAGTLQA